MSCQKQKKVKEQIPFTMEQMEEVKKLMPFKMEQLKEFVRRKKGQFFNFGKPTKKQLIIYMVKNQITLPNDEEMKEILELEQGISFLMDELRRVREEVNREEEYGIIREITIEPNGRIYK